MLNMYSTNWIEMTYVQQTVFSNQHNVGILHYGVLRRVLMHLTIAWVAMTTTSCIALFQW